jgi:UDP-N-acetylglucosamine 3-dehydrogenase
MRIGIIGAGSAASFHASAFSGNERTEIVGIADIVPELCERFAAQFGIPKCYKPEDLVSAPDVQIVDICTPTDTHRYYTELAARSRKHIFCEKPIALNLDDAQDMISACKKARVALGVGQVLRFFPEYVKIRELLAEGAVGDVQVLSASRCARMPRGRDDWFRDIRKSGGAIFDLAIHDIDFLVWCFGTVKTVFVRRVSLDGGEHLHIIARFERGHVAHIEASWAEVEGFYSHFEAAGDKGLLTFDSRDATPLLVNRKKKEEEPAVIIPESPLKESPYLLEMLEFIRFVEEGVSPRVTAADAVYALAVALAAQESAENRVVVCPGRPSFTGGRV